MREVFAAIIDRTRRHRARVSAAVGVAAFLLLLSFPSLRGWVWTVALADSVVIMVVVGAATLALFGQPRASASGPRSGHSSAANRETVTMVLAGLAVFVTYTSFRNQSRLAAELGLNTEGQMLSQTEMANPGLRCLYSGFAHDDPRSCLADIVKDRASWTAASFYVENVFWLLEKAENDRRVWGSAYSRDIDYWREYVDEDPTGMFSYYLVTFHGGYDGARSAMERSAVDIPGVCRKYWAVRTTLDRAGARPALAVRCQ